MIYISSTSNQLDESSIKFKMFNGTSSVSVFWSKGWKESSLFSFASCSQQVLCWPFLTLPTHGDQPRSIHSTQHGPDPACLYLVPVRFQGVGVSLLKFVVNPINDMLIDWLGFFVVSEVFQPFYGGYQWYKTVS